MEGGRGGTTEISEDLVPYLEVETEHLRHASVGKAKERRNGCERIL